MSCQLTEIAWNADLPVEQKLVYLAAADAVGSQWDGLDRESLIAAVSRMTGLGKEKASEIISQLDSDGRFQ